MHSIRTISDEERRALKGMTAAALKFVGLSAFQFLTRVKVSALSKYGSAGEEHRDDFIPVDVAVEADRACGEPLIIGEAARMLGYRLVKDDGAEDSVSPAQVVALGAQASRTIEAAYRAVEDLRIDARERAELTPMLIELQRKTADMLSRVAGGAR
ncbi:hypothetical protein M2360_000908 [Rhizobium sp. SG_E_25_P2]|uniref:hypothetical protein n=1 Tax=Rhizobium sp. SG_E_25_P2 TaxID=2879942 RepID=UPI002473D51B|nr:hypothetical protein [Rhizobium sp. SG_E_25_P2]MDH6265518.1 hypothetical protein [Rhizobium sp. SG_E_25_P2]